MEAVAEAADALRLRRDTVTGGRAVAVVVTVVAETEVPKAK